MKSIFLLILFVFPVRVAAAPQKLSFLSQRIEILTDGSAIITYRGKVDSLTRGAILLPFPFNGNPKFMTDGQSSKDFRLADSNFAKYIVVSDSAYFAKKNFAITALLPSYYPLQPDEKSEFGHIGVKQKFVNNAFCKIEKLSVFVVLPAGYVIHSIDESVPKVQSNNPEFPYSLESENGKHAVQLRAKEIKPGDSAMISFTIKKEEKSKVFLAVLLFLAAGYMYFYRDVLKAAEKKEI